MKFKGNGIVWDPEKNRRLCKFINGLLETEDEYIIKRMFELGYDNVCMVTILNPELHDDEPTEVQTLEELSKDELKELAKEKGVKGYGTMKKETLIERLSL